MRRLSGLDATFLWAETPTAHMHVVGVMVLDPSTAPEPFTAESVRSLILRRLDRLPAFRRKLLPIPFNLHYPMWMEDPDLDIDYHVRRIAVAKPGGPAELAEVVGQLASRQLDRTKPLWEFWVVEGLEDGNVALVAKAHHALIDGMSSVAILASLFDVEPDPVEVGTGRPTILKLDRTPSAVELLARAWIDLARQPMMWIRAGERAIQSALAVRSRLQSDEVDESVLPLSAPRVSFNRALSAQRSTAFAEVPLADVKRIKTALGVTVNDVVLAICTGALRTYLGDNEELPERSLVAAVPASTRDASGAATLGNMVSAIFAGLPVHIPDPIEQVQHIRAMTAGGKAVHDAFGPTTLQQWAEIAAPSIFGRAMRAYSSLKLADRGPVIANTIISNVPGPNFPMFLAGARLVSFSPLGPIMDGIGLNITVFSYMETIGFGLMADTESMPEVARLAAAMSDSATSILKAVEEREGASTSRAGSPTRAKTKATRAATS